MKIIFFLVAVMFFSNTVSAQMPIDTDLKLMPYKNTGEIEKGLEFIPFNINTNIYYSIISKHSGLPLNIRGQSMLAGKDLYQDGDKRKRTSGKFRFTQISDGTYRITILHSMKSLSGALDGKEGGAFVQDDFRDDSKQLFRIKRVGDNLVKISPLYSNRIMVVEANSTYHGTTMREGVERNNSNEVFELLPEGSVINEEAAQKARGLLNEGIKLAQNKMNEQAGDAFQQAVGLAPNDGSILSEAGQWLVVIKSDDRAIDVLERALQADGFAPRALRDLFNLYWKKRDWHKALTIADKAIVYRKQQLLKDPRNGGVSNELIEAYGIKTNTFNQLADWQKALQTADEGFALIPNTNNRQIIYAKGEALHVTAGLKVNEKDYGAAEKLIDEAIRTYENSADLIKGKGRYSDLVAVKQLLAKKKELMNVTPASVQRVLTLIVNGIDINQVVNGKDVKIRDGFPEAMKQRIRAGQAWYGLYIECETEGQVAVAFKNVDVGIAGRVNSDGLVQIKVDSIAPSVAPLISKHRNFDTYAFYWNGATSGLNNGTGEGGGSWPMTLAGVSVGQPRGVAVMAANPEMYGVFDGLLHHEYGHVLEVIANITFVHCGDITASDRKKPEYTGWNGKCEDIYSWVLGSFMKNRYKDMNWAARYPAK